LRKTLIVEVGLEWASSKAGDEALEGREVVRYWH
jgi:hypothetical protein